jgi:hypothetical protein
MSLLVIGLQGSECEDRREIRLIGSGDKGAQRGVELQPTAKPARRTMNLGASWGLAVGCQLARFGGRIGIGLTGR